MTLFHTVFFPAKSNYGDCSRDWYGDIKWCNNYQEAILESKFACKKYFILFIMKIVHEIGMAVLNGVTTNEGQVSW